jgi:anti-sigma B factor antagonist
MLPNRHDLRQLRRRPWLTSGAVAANPFRVESVRNERHAVVLVAGELDALTAPRVHDELVALAGQGVDRIVLDLRALDFVDSFGLGVIVSARRRLSQEGNALCLVAGDGQRTLRRVLEITGLDQVLPVHPTVAAAVEDCLAEPAA